MRKDDILRIDRLVGRELDNLKNEILKRENSRIPKKNIMEFAIKQLIECTTCNKKFWKWVRESRAAKKK